MVADLADLERQNKRQAACHEAGHLTVALARGVRAGAGIHRNDGADPMEDKLWGGQCGFLFVRPTPEVYAAGVIAEYLDDEGAWEDAFNAGWIAAGLMDALGATVGVMSPTDLEHFPTDEREPYRAFRQAARLLYKHREFFKWAVAELLEHEGITDGRAWDQFHGAYTKQGRPRKRRHLQSASK